MYILSDTYILGDIHHGTDAVGYFFVAIIQYQCDDWLYFLFWQKMCHIRMDTVLLVVGCEGFDLPVICSEVVAHNFKRRRAVGHVLVF